MDEKIRVTKIGHRYLLPLEEFGELADALDIYFSINGNELPREESRHTDQHPYLEGMENATRRYDFNGELVYVSSGIANEEGSLGLSQVVLVSDAGDEGAVNAANDICGLFEGLSVQKVMYMPKP